MIDVSVTLEHDWEIEVPRSERLDHSSAASKEKEVLIGVVKSNRGKSGGGRVEWAGATAATIKAPVAAAVPPSVVAMIARSGRSRGSPESSRCGGGCQRHPLRRNGCSRRVTE